MEFGLGGPFAGTLQRRINVVFPSVVNFPWFQQWNALLSESACACQHNFDSFPATAHARGIGRPENTPQRDGGSVHAQWCEVGQGPILLTCRRSRNLSSGERSTVSAEASDEVWG